MRFLVQFAVALTGSILAVFLLATVTSGIYGAGRQPPAATQPAAGAQQAAAKAPSAPATPAAPAAAPAQTGASIAVRLAAADVAQSTTVRVACVSCHTFDKGGANRVGPNLWGIVGREKAEMAGFAFSDAMKKAGGRWTFEDLDRFLTAPKDMVPGTKMSFPGIADPAARANLIAFLRTLAETPAPLPAP